jgi:hypothetical protein
VTDCLTAGLGRAGRALALWLCLAALAIQGLAPLCLAGLMPSFAGTQSIILCTAHGFETVQLGRDGKPVPGTPAPNQQNSTCPLCAGVQAASGLITPVAVVLAVPVFVSRVRRLIASTSISFLRAHFSYVTRAPPAAAFSSPA